MAQQLSTSAQVKEYATPIDRESARELLAKRIAADASDDDEPDAVTSVFASNRLRRRHAVRWPRSEAGGKRFRKDDQLAIDANGRRGGRPRDHGRVAASTPLDDATAEKPLVVASRLTPASRPRKCERGDSNPHRVRDWILSPARLPIPPLPHMQNGVDRMRSPRLSSIAFETYLSPPTLILTTRVCPRCISGLKTRRLTISPSLARDSID